MEHGIDLYSIVLGLSILFGLTFVTRGIVIRLGMVPVVGVLLTALGTKLVAELVGYHIPEEFMNSIHSLSEIGVWGILFLAGLELNYAKLRKSGPTSLRTAVAGMLGPILLGIGFITFIASETSLTTRVFFGLLFSATSVGVPLIVAREVKRRTAINTEAMVTLSGAGVIDDVLAILGYALMLSAVGGAELQIGALVMQNVFTVLYIIGSVFVDPIIGRLVGRLHIIHTRQKLLFVLCWAGLNIGLAHLIGVSGAVAAFCAGVQLDEAHFFSRNGEEKMEHTEEIIDQFLTPFVTLFFVNAGLVFPWSAVSLRTVVLGVASFAIVGFMGKYVMTRIVVRGHQGHVVGLGMAHFAEVAILVATTGLATGVLSADLFAMGMIGIITSLITMPTFFAKAVRLNPEKS